MTATITLFEEGARTVAAAFEATALETVAFGFAGRVQRDDSVGLIVREVEVVPDDGYRERSGGHFSLQPSFVAEMALRADERGDSLVIMHSHPGADFPPDFSAVDARMHQMLVPNLLRQMPGPVGSLVRSPAGWNGRVWQTADAELRLAHLRIVGRHLTLSLPAQHREGPDLSEFERQIRAFGEPLQLQLGELRVGIVGLGGGDRIAGSAVAGTSGHR